MTSWLNATGANKIMIVDDETSQNPFLKSVFKSAVPANVKVGVFNEAKAVDRLIKGFKPTDRVIVLAKYPQTFLSLVERGASLRQVIIGGMGAREDRSRLYRNISASQDERAALRASWTRAWTSQFRFLRTMRRSAFQSFCNTFGLYGALSARHSMRTKGRACRFHSSKHCLSASCTTWG